jgi:hypothetical protein
MADSGRICTRCSTWKSAECFYRRRDQPGLVSICKECTASKYSRRPTPVARPCATCYEYFQPKRDRATYCSEVCGARARARKQAELESKPPRKILIVDGHKRCNRCNEWKSLSAFGVRKSRKDAPLTYCRDCMKDQVAHYQRTDRARSVRYAYKYGVTLEWYEATLAAQQGGCAICDAPPDAGNPIHPRLAIDHCHQTGNARGLLCFLCNSALGRFDDKPELLLRAHAYLTRPNDFASGLTTMTDSIQV